MKAVIMAGGKGTRLRPLTCNVPKPMVPILNIPMMEYIIELLARHNFTEILVTLHYLADQIEQYFGDGKHFGVNIKYFTETTPLGTAGSVKMLEPYLHETFLVISGDALTDIDLTKALKFHQEKKAIATILLKNVENPLEYGVVITDSSGRIGRFLEKPSWSEVFSDTVNTGIYYLEPEIFRFYKSNTNFDFSKDLFPLLLGRNYPLYGYIADGYWSDIGNIEQYRQAHYDFLAGKINLKIPGFQLRPGLWAGENVEISNSAKLGNYIHIGNDCSIGENVIIQDFSVIGNHTFIGNGVSIKRSIVGNYSYLGHEASLSGAILGDHCVLKSQVSVYEGAIIGEGCSLHEKTSVKPKVKIWPHKIIEKGSIVNDSLIWGDRLSRSLFGRRGIGGLINREFTPEFSAKLGAAFGSSLPKKGYLVISSDHNAASRMNKRAMTAGLLSVGINAYDLGTMPPPVTRYAITVLKASGGINIRVMPDNPDYLLCEFFDENGLNLEKNKEKAVENIFWLEDFPRMDHKHLGQVIFVPRLIDQYLDGLFESLDIQKIQNRKFKVVTSHNSGMLSLLLPSFLKRCGCEVYTPPAPEKDNSHPEGCTDCPEYETLINAVLAEKANLGLLVDPNVEKLVLIDEKGKVLRDEMFLALISLIVFKYSSDPIMSIPVTAPAIIEKMAENYRGKVIRTKDSPRSTMERTIQQKIFADTKTPGFYPTCDALVSLGRILELMAKEDIPLSALVEMVPEFYMRKDSVFCPWQEKGRVMRTIIENSKTKNQVELIDGIKIYHDHGWALIMPDSEEPVFKVLSEASSQEEADALAHMYMEQINNIQLH